MIGADEGRIFVRVAEAYANCPKYIQRRALHLTDDRTVFADIREGVDLDPEQQELIASADTFFIASAGPERKLDVSHRGGRPGFVRIDGDRLWIPDYAGNNMYNTLGNLSVNPTTGLLFLDFGTGDTLQLSGVAKHRPRSGRHCDRWHQPRVDVHDDLVDTLATGRTVARRVPRDVTAQSLSSHPAAAPASHHETCARTWRGRSRLEGGAADQPACP